MSGLSVTTELSPMCSRLQDKVTGKIITALAVKLAASERAANQVLRVTESRN